jgi:outer membrane protein OmpA-like peptidoglycan-associated protein
MNLSYLSMRKAVIIALTGFVPVLALAQAITPRDTVNVRNSHNMRQALYETNQDPFAPPRKNNWSIGIQTGNVMLTGDVDPQRGLGVGLNIRKALGHMISLRLQGSTGTTRGLNWRANGGYFFNRGLNGFNNPDANYLTAAYPYVFYNYKMRFWESNLQMVFNIGNINFYKSMPKVGLYTFAGVGGMLYRTQIDALDADGNIYDYSGIAASQNPDNRKDVKNSLQNLLDGDYETDAEFHEHKPKVGNSTFLPNASFGLGLALRVSRRVDLTLEHRATWSGEDLLDGQRWEETRTLTANSDILQFTSIGINFKIGKGEESYWWQNPLNRVYSDVRDLKRFNRKDDKDTDRDGVVDSRDREPNTPEGVLVDSQGRAVDSDGDSYQDYRDSEPFSPKGAQVDSKGVARDTDGDGVIDLYDIEPNTAAGASADAKGRTVVSGPAPTPTAIPLLPIVNFDLDKSEIKEEYIEAVYTVAKMMGEYPDMKIRVIGHADTRGNTKHNEDLSKARATAVASLLVRGFGIAKDRLVIEYKGDGTPMVRDITKVNTRDNEQLHFLNRRVEFEIVK